jgi:5-methylcytosine-specific restriction endonuclease McrA
MKCIDVNVPIHIDHIKPRSKYPELELEFDNLQVLCATCNVKKSNIDETDYRSI